MHAHCTLGGSIVQLFDVKNLALGNVVVIVSNFLINKE